MRLTDCKISHSEVKSAKTPILYRIKLRSTSTLYFDLIKLRDLKLSNTLIWLRFEWRLLLREDHRFDLSRLSARWCPNWWLFLPQSRGSHVMKARLCKWFVQVLSVSWPLSKRFMVCISRESKAIWRKSLQRVGFPSYKKEFPLARGKTTHLAKWADCHSAACTNTGSLWA